MTDQKPKQTCCEKYSGKFTISPEGYFYHMWHFFVMFLSMASSCMYAYFAVFRSDVDFHNYDDYFEHLEQNWNQMYYFSEKEINMFNKAVMGVEAVFFIVIVSHFFLEYQD